MVRSLHGLDPAGGSHAALGTERARQGPGDRRLAPPASGAPSANRSSAVSLERPALPRRRERPPDAGDGERLATRGLRRDWSPQAPPGARDVPPWGRRPPGLSWRGQPEVSARPAASATGTRETEREIATTRTGSLEGFLVLTHPPRADHVPVRRTGAFAPAGKRRRTPAVRTTSRLSRRQPASPDSGEPGADDPSTPPVNHWDSRAMTPEWLRGPGDH
jgi:hypothetical protein